MRHFGADTPVTQITKLQVERYQQYLADTVGDAATRVEALKLFLSDLKTKKLTETNLGAGLRVRRRGGSSQARREEAAVVELVADGRLAQTGFIKQEDIPFDDLLSTKNGALFADLGKV